MNEIEHQLELLTQQLDHLKQDGNLIAMTFFALGMSIGFIIGSFKP